MYRFYRYFYQLHTIKILLFGISIPLLINALFVSLDMIWSTNETDHFDGYAITIGSFFTIVLIAPFIETLVSQYIPLKIAGLFIKKYQYIYCYTILCVSVFFGLMHSKSILYSVIAFFYGLIWSFCCLVFIRRKQHPLFFTTLIHACYNGLLFGGSFLLTYLE
jgi:membrane protease YdiL (CAAX protease family)